MLRFSRVSVLLVGVLLLVGCVSESHERSLLDEFSGEIIVDAVVLPDSVEDCEFLVSFLTGYGWERQGGGGVLEILNVQDVRYRPAESVCVGTGLTLVGGKHHSNRVLFSAVSFTEAAVYCYVVFPARGAHVGDHVWELRGCDALWDSSLTGRV